VAVFRAGQYVLCLFSNDTACEEWAYYRGECDATNPIFSAFCADGGGQISRESVDWGDVEGAPAVEYEVCTTNGIECTDADYYSNVCKAETMDDSFGDVCLTEEECRERSEALSFDFYSGHYETKGCYSKTGMILFSPGTVDEMSDPGPLSGVRERVYCDAGTAIPPAVETSNIFVDEAPATTTTVSSPTSAEGTIAEFVMNDSDFSGLASLIETAGLADDLEETGPFTVFGMHYQCNYCMDEVFADSDNDAVS